MNDIDFQNGLVVGMTLGAKFSGGSTIIEGGGGGFNVVVIEVFTISPLTALYPIA